MSKHFLLHKINGYKDVGIDYLGELLVEDTPSRIIFGIQVKTSENMKVEVKSKGINRRLNELGKFSVSSVAFKIEEKTVNYWKGFGIPLYLFLVLRSANSGTYDCYYSRLTPILHSNSDIDTKIKQIHDGDFYKVNNGMDFCNIIKKESMDGGFSRDLFIDSLRCSYQNGSIFHRSPKEFGLDNWPENNLYPDVLGEKTSSYQERLKQSLLFLEQFNLVTISDNFDDIIEKFRNEIRSKK